MQTMAQELSSLKLAYKALQTQKVQEAQESDRLRKQDKMEMDKRMRQLSDDFTRELRTSRLPPVRPPDPNNFPGPNDDHLSKTATDKDTLERAQQASAIEHYKAAQIQERRSLVELVKDQRIEKEGLLAEQEARLAERQEKENCC